MTSCPEAMGWEFGDFEKVVSWDPTLGRASPAGGYGMRSAFVGSDGTVSLVKLVSLSSCRKTKVKKLINVSYLNNGESSVFRISLHLYICIAVSWLYNSHIEDIHWGWGPTFLHFWDVIGVFYSPSRLGWPHSKGDTTDLNVVVTNTKAVCISVARQTKTKCHNLTWIDLFWGLTLFVFC